MNIAGIVGEYNPFHYGHLYHLSETKIIIPDCAVVCAMSGDFVQRGEPALFDKFVRAEAACRSGVDLVLELPVRWALSSAEGFARGAVQLLGYAGAEYISFGSECGDIEEIRKAADFLCERAVIERTVKKMKEEKALSFAAARQMILSEYSPSLAAIIEKPNNILAVEYVKAINELKLNMKPITVGRTGSGHDLITGEGILSASEIRQRVRAGEEIERFVPESAAAVYRNAIENGRAFDEDTFGSVLMSRLRMFDNTYYNKLPDVAEGLGERIYRASRESTDLSSLYEKAKTKKYAMSRIRRACICACIGITNERETNDVPYVRVLAANKKGRLILKAMSGSCPSPVIIKPSSVNKYDNICQKMYADGVSANDLYVLGYKGKSARYGGQDWSTSPKIVDN